MSTTPRIQRALLSVSDKTGILDLARALVDLKVDILSTGGTAALLREHAVPVTEVSDHTGFPEMMDGRVKTLHPKIHGGILGRRGTDDAVMASAGISPIDLLVVNLYPFQATVAKPDCDLPTAIENIDIGGPTMLRAAAKNHRDVTVIVDPADYARLLDEMTEHQGATTAATRYQLAVKTFEHTAQYDGAIANYLGAIAADGTQQPYAQTLNLQYRLAETLRYGENPHQQAAFYVQPGATESGVATAEQLQGKALSYNNIADTDAALECVKQFDTPACVIVKHANPCGVACAEGLFAAYDDAYRTDPESAFGGIIAFNRSLDEATAQAIVERQFVEVLVAPAISVAAQAVLARKKNLRVLACGSLAGSPKPRNSLKQVHGGVLLQDEDLSLYQELRVVTDRKPSPVERNDLLFAWQVAKFVKSNAIVYAKGCRTIGVGAGQMSRVNSARIAVDKAAQAGLTVAGAVMASDAFFPFRDGIDHAAAAGILAVIQPGGSKRDDEVIAAANEQGISMIFTGMRHFRHA